MNKPYEVLQDSTKTESSPLNKDISCDANIPDLDEILEYQETIEEGEDNQEYAKEANRRFHMPPLGNQHRKNEYKH